MSIEYYALHRTPNYTLLRLVSSDHTNKLSRACVCAWKAAIEKLAEDALPLIITGNEHFFSAGADLHEIAQLTGPAAFEFAQLGQNLMRAVDLFPAPVIAAVQGYCMGGGLDLALACDFRIAAPDAVFGHRGAALGLMTGWGGTQRLPRLIGKARALEMFILAEKVSAKRALQMGLVSRIADDPIKSAVETLSKPSCHWRFPW
ncbi:MAG: enoyl-CoA hydratase [Candidatus Angelobacter sp. Gp1-AA117]|nr:MAG: enoyl-CoA hydratase [Candidatus Angelobacter sp. Gp1-AA117]